MVNFSDVLKDQNEKKDINYLRRSIEDCLRKEINNYLNLKQLHEARRLLISIQFILGGYRIDSTIQKGTTDLRVYKI